MPVYPKYPVSVFMETDDEKLIARCLFKVIKEKTGENNGKILVKALNHYNQLFDEKGNRI